MVAILVAAWRRPDKVRQVINNLRNEKPSKLYMACDGPDLSREGEKERVEATRSVIDQEIDWDCDVKKLYSVNNLGCFKGITSAINWFFENEEEGIILEDDCIPHKDFFPYCEELLEKYKEDNRVWNISGSNFQNGLQRGDGSYYFSKYFHCWGWATWRKSWINFDSQLSQLLKLYESNLLSTIFQSSKERKYWTKIWNRLLKDSKPDTWDYRWAFTCFINGALTILPNKNLVKNIGFDNDASNTNFSLEGSFIDEGILPLKHPSFILADKFADDYTFKNHYHFSLAKRIRKILLDPTYYPKKAFKLI